MPEKRPRGRPRKIQSPEQLLEGIEDYRVDCELKGEPITLTGCLYSMGIYSRGTLDEYEARPGFSEPVKQLRAMVAMAYERRLHGQNPTGAIFALKNMGWTDRQEIDATITGNLLDVLTTLPLARRREDETSDETQH